MSLDFSLITFKIRELSLVISKVTSALTIRDLSRRPGRLPKNLLAANG